MPDAGTLLALWDQGGREHPIDRALSVLAAFTGEPRGALAALPVHRRDQLLLSSRIAAFGPVLDGVAACPACGGRIETALTLPPPPVPAADGGEVIVDGDVVRFRVPDSHDLAEAARAPDAGTAANLLLSRCQISGAADPAAARAIDAALERLCDATSLELSMACPHCREAIVVPVDIGVFFWEELDAFARRLVDDVDTLALRYGWSEADILGMPEQRRRRYLERCP